MATWKEDIIKALENLGGVAHRSKIHEEVSKIREGNLNNTWTLTYNVSGNGEFNFDDLFLTGVDPLNVGEVGGTQAVIVEGEYSFLGAKVEYILGVMALIVGALVLFI